MNIFNTIFNKKSKKESNNHSENSQENLEEEKKDMIQGVQDLSETFVKEIMIPRIDVDFISLDISEDELMSVIAKSGHSRFPVYSDSVDNVVGVLYVKDLIKVFASKQKVDLNQIIRKAYFIPESKKIDSLLLEFKRRHIHIAIVIDEYGGTSGIICMEDIIEEIVGDIQDEFDNEREDIIFLADNVFLCDGRISLSDLNESISSNFPTENCDTLGGFVFDLFGRIPNKFEKISWENFDFIVQEMEGHKINLIKLINHKSEV